MDFCWTQQNGSNRYFVAENCFWVYMFVNCFPRSNVYHCYLHPWSLSETWNLKISPWKRRFLLETIIFRFHVKLWEGNLFTCNKKTTGIRLRSFLQDKPLSSVGVASVKLGILPTQSISKYISLRRQPFLIVVVFFTSPSQKTWFSPAKWLRVGF